MTPRKWSIEKIQKVSEEKGGRLISTMYLGTTSPLVFMCSAPGCNTTFTRTLSEYIPGGGKCKRCSRKHIYNNHRTSIHEVERLVNERGSKTGSVFISAKGYTDSKKSLIQVKCGKCGSRFERPLSSIKRSPCLLCRKCSGKNGQNSKRHTYVDVQNHIESHGNTLLSKEYKGLNSSLEIKCKCGKPFERTYETYLRQKAHYCQGCSNGSRRNKQFRRLSLDDIKRYLIKQGCSHVSGDYVNVYSKIVVRCRCNKEFVTSYVRMYSSKHKSCPACSSQGSTVEEEIKEYLTSIKVHKICEKTKEIIPPKELDIYLPEYNVGIEVNGLYWHGESHGGKSKDYHLNKTEKCESLGIRLIHVTDQEWFTNADKIKSLLRSALGIAIESIPARKCSITHIDDSSLRSFLQKHHLQNYVTSSINYGLYYAGVLVSVMSFSKSRFDKNAQYELLRYCTLPGYRIIGGAAKLFSHFTRNHSPLSVVTYSDRSKFSGEVYEKLGFIKTHNSPPGYMYYELRRINKVYSREKFQKHKLKNLLPKYDINLSEWENMKANGYDRYWNCGNGVYLWKR